jgi:hypothetical protein
LQCFIQIDANKSENTLIGCTRYHVDRVMPQFQDNILSACAHASMHDTFLPRSTPTIDVQFHTGSHEVFTVCERNS